MKPLVHHEAHKKSKIEPIQNRTSSSTLVERPNPIVTDQKQILGNVLRATGNSGDVYREPTGILQVYNAYEIRSITDLEDKHDLHISQPGLFYCNRCLKNYPQDVCNFVIFLGPKTSFILTIRVDGGFKPIEMIVMDGVEGYNKIDMNITAHGDYMFTPSGNVMYIRLDGRRVDLTNLQFGFSIKHAHDSVDGQHGCSAILTSPVRITLPHNIKYHQQFGFCYWKCPPEDEKNCYLKFLRIFDGAGTKRIRMNGNFDTSQTIYGFTQKVIVLEYFGPPVDKETQLALNLFF